MNLLGLIQAKGYSGAWNDIFNDNYVTSIGNTGNGLNIIAYNTGPNIVLKGITGTNITVNEVANNLQLDVSESIAPIKVFEYNGNVVRPTTNHSDYDINSDFVFGSQQLDDADNSAEDSRIIFDKSSGTFCVGTANGTQWDTRGARSFIGGGLNNSVTGTNSVALGGNGNIVSGESSVGMGNGSTVTHYNSFVWSDGTSRSSTNTGEVTFGATGGFRILGDGNNTPSYSTGQIYIDADETVMTGRLTTGDIIETTGIQLEENSSRPDVSKPGIGTLWIKGTSTNVPFFSDDSNVDHQLAYIDSVTLGSTGNGLSLVSDGIGPKLVIRGITGGTGINMTGNGSSLEIDGIIFKLEENKFIRNTYKDDLTGQHFISTNMSNEITGGGRSSILGGNSCTVSAANSISIGGTNNESNGTASCILGGSDNSTSRSISQIFGGTDNNMINGSRGIVAASGGSILSSQLDSCILGGTGHNIDTNFSSIIGGSNNKIQASTDQIESIILGGQDHVIRTYSQYKEEETSSTIMGGFNSTLESPTGTIGTRIQSSIVLGSNSVIRHQRVFAFSDDQGTTGIGSIGDAQFLVRCAGGATFYSNTTNTTGVTISSGGSSWGSVSDRNVKDNLHNLGSTGNSIIAKKFYSIPICTFNYIGAPEEQLCYGLMAQDWHKEFGATGITRPILDNHGKPIINQETSEYIYETKPAKDPLKIETMDMLGILMATTNDIHNRIDVFKNDVQSFDNELIQLKSIFNNMSM